LYGNIQGSGRSPSAPIDFTCGGRSEIARYLGSFRLFANKSRRKAAPTSYDNALLKKGSRRKAAPTSCDNALLKKVLALVALFILHTGCLNSKPIEKETVTLQLDTPSASWTAEPLEAWETDNTLYCVFQLYPPEGMSAQVISSVASEMHLPASSKPKKFVALGKTWKWSSGKDIAFPESLQSFRNQLPKGAKRVELLAPDA